MKSQNRTTKKKNVVTIERGIGPHIHLSLSSFSLLLLLLQSGGEKTTEEKRIVSE
jgi:hypothetical protein